MPNPGKCPGESVFNKGKVRVQAVAATEAAAFAAMQLLLPQAKIDAETAQTAAYRAALAVGDAGCKPGVAPCDPCSAIYLGQVIGPWEGAITQADNTFLARGGYKWEVLVICECPEEKDKEEPVQKKA
ncbi:MAG: hypothetical protein HRT89_00790 [Lentisphaeria bacterium]|nr:hypothetical protein [Lentisphaeria bacterium]NQZ66579.1 hypothetical protein [Lentisphaeria bacterium]